MISVENAKLLVLQHSLILGSEEQYLIQSLGQTLASDIHAPISLPSFMQSAVDGYALGSSDTYNAGTTFNLTHEIQAGNTNPGSVGDFEAARIFTGAAVPENTQTIVMQEATEIINDKLALKKDIASKMNIRSIGEQIVKGDLALNKGHILNPASIGLLKSLGIDHVNVFRKPMVAIAITGNELLSAGTELKTGQIYESNADTLSAALVSANFSAANIVFIKDNLDDTISSLSDISKEHDVLIISGGISVGDYDFVGTALKANHADVYFYKVNQKPGKPMLFGKLGKCLIFALPGNPAAALTCFYEYVFPSLRKQSAADEVTLKQRKLPINIEYNKKGDRAEFLKGKISNGMVDVLEGQSSAMLHSFASSNCLIYIPEDTQTINKGDLVEVHILPGFGY